MKKCILLLLLGLYTNNSQTIDEPHSLKTDVVIFSYDRPLQLYSMLESLYLYTQDINSVAVIYRASNDRFNAAFNEVALQFPDATFLHQKTIDDFKILTVNAIENSSTDYILFAVDDNLVKDTTSLAECITWLEKTGAYGFYLKLGTHLNYCYTENHPQALPPYTIIADTICSWEFEDGERDWHYPNTVDMTLYRKKDIIGSFRSLPYTNPNNLESHWAAWWVQHKAPSSFGLFYTDSKILNIPLNKVQSEYISNRDMNLYTPEELLEKFEQGYKMDIAPLHQMKNIAVHTEYEPTFIIRK